MAAWVLLPKWTCAWVRMERQQTMMNKRGALLIQQIIFKSQANAACRYPCAPLKSLARQHKLPKKTSPAPSRIVGKKGIRHLGSLSLSLVHKLADGYPRGCNVHSQVPVTIATVLHFISCVRSFVVVTLCLLSLKTSRLGCTARGIAHTLVRRSELAQGRCAGTLNKTCSRKL